MISAETCNSWLLRVSKDVLAEAIKRLKTSADIVAISAMPSFTTSFDSLLKCPSGSMLFTDIASNALPKTRANTSPPIAIVLTTHPPAAAPRPRSDHRQLDGEARQCRPSKDTLV